MSKGKWSEEKKKAWSEKCKNTNCNNKTKTNEFYIKGVKRLRGYWDKNPWNAKNSEKHSIAMKKAVLNNPESYSKNNVSGRAKLYEIYDSIGLTKVKGSWELKVAEFLNQNNIKWTNKIEPYKYFWNNDWHLYYPDFHLLDKDIILEIKGYEVERDQYKWQSVKDITFFILKQKEINDLKLFFNNIFAAIP